MKIFPDSNMLAKQLTFIELVCIFAKKTRQSEIKYQHININLVN